MTQTAIVDWRAFPTADEVRAHWHRTTGDKPWEGYGRWLCEATGEIHALSACDDQVSVENWEGDWDRIDDPSMAKERASRWLPVGKTGLPEIWPLPSLTLTDPPRP